MLEHQNNPNWPLPVDYYELSAERQQEERLAVLHNQGTPDDYVVAWQFFREHYLKPRDIGPRFYKVFKKSGPLHYHITLDMATYDFNIETAPRGSAKSTVGAMEQILFLALTRPYVEIAVCWATDRMVHKRFNVFMKQFTRNKRIIQDFGTMKPKRGDGVWEHELLMLANGSVIEGFSVNGRQRGTRPDIYILDDPEKDEEGKADRRSIQHKFETLLFHEIIPMLDDGCSCTWLGTIIDRRSMLYIATRERGDPDANPKYVERFATWNKRVVDADADREGAKVWPAKFTSEFLDLKMQRMGKAAYFAEYKNAPISEEESLIHLDPVLNGYLIDGSALPQHSPDPLMVDAVVKYHEIPPRLVDGTFPEGVDIEQHEERVAPFFSKMYRFMTVDWAWSKNRRSDHNACAVWGLHKYTLWLLDFYCGKHSNEPGDNSFIEQIFTYGTRWSPVLVAMEAEGRGTRLTERAHEYIAAHGPGRMWIPRVLPVKYPKAEISDKASRFAPMEWRFKQGRVKVPFQLEHDPMWRQVWNQINNFTMDLALLTRDEVIDLCSLTRYVARSPRQNVTDGGDKTAFEAALRKHRETGQMIGAGYNASDLSPEFIDELLAYRHDGMYDEDDAEYGFSSCAVIEGRR